MLPDRGQFRRAGEYSRVAFFDLDKTIIARSSTLAFGVPFYRSGLISRSDVLRSVFRTVDLPFRRRGPRSAGAHPCVCFSAVPRLARRPGPRDRRGEPRKARRAVPVPGGARATRVTQDSRAGSGRAPRFGAARGPAGAGTSRSAGRSMRTGQSIEITNWTRGGGSKHANSW